MLINVLDNTGKPIGVMREEYIHSQKLYHNRILLLAYDNSRNLCLVKDKNSKKWDLPVNQHVVFNRSKEEELTRSFEKTYGIKISPKIFISNYLNANTYEFITIFIAKKTTYPFFIKDQTVEEVIFIDRQDLSSLIKNFPEYTTYYLRFCYNWGFTFVGINDKI